MNDVWRELTFCDTDLDLKKNRNPVAPAKRSDSANKKASTKKSIGDIEAQSFESLLKELAYISKVFCSSKQNEASSVFLFEKNPELTPLQRKAFELLKNIPSCP
jgi:hypothetical protein